MIEQRFIEASKEIRKKYIQLSDELDKNKSNVQKLTSYLEDKVGDLDSLQKELNTNIKTKEQFMEISKKILEKITEIEEKEKSLSNNISKINDKMELLKKEEIHLLKMIKQKHPELTTDQIRTEIHSKL